jgi:hypothetical protein
VGVRGLPPVPGFQLPRVSLPSRVVPLAEADNGSLPGAKLSSAQCHNSVTGRWDTVHRRNYLGA